MMTGRGIRWFRVLQEGDRRRTRRNVMFGIYLPTLAGILIFALVTSISPSALPEDLIIGGSSGGGGGDEQEYDMEFGPTAGDEGTTDESSVKTVSVELVNIRIIRPNMISKKPVAKADTKKKRKQQHASVSGPPPVRRIRGTGPGTGGGTGGGSGGGIGGGIGYSIDWGGEGGRRLLSGRLPKYPPGTEAEMAITVGFTVLADGTVATVMPGNRGDEILEREAVSAIRTWRFEALPEQVGDKTQRGSVVFNFKLEKATTVRP